MTNGPWPMTMEVTFKIVKIYFHFMIFLASDLGVGLLNTHCIVNNPLSHSPFSRNIVFHNFDDLRWVLFPSIYFWYSLELCLGVRLSNTQARRPPSTPPNPTCNTQPPLLHLLCSQLLTAFQCSANQIKTFKGPNTHIWHIKMKLHTNNFPNTCFEFVCFWFYCYRALSF